MSNKTNAATTMTGAPPNARATVPRSGAAIDVWLKQENNWVSDRYQATQTNDGALETKFAMLQTERTGGRPIFLGYKVRRAS
jgi:hypothetical protein